MRWYKSVCVVCAFHLITQELIVRLMSDKQIQEVPNESFFAVLDLIQSFQSYVTYEWHKSAA